MTARHLAAAGCLVLGIAVAAVPVELLDPDWDVWWMIWIAWQTLPFVPIARAVVGGVDAGPAVIAAGGVALAATVAYWLLATATDDVTLMVVVVLPVLLVLLARTLLRVEWS